MELVLVYQQSKKRKSESCHAYLEAEIGLFESRTLHGGSSGLLTPRPDLLLVGSLRQASRLVLGEPQRVLLPLELGRRLGLLRTRGVAAVVEPGRGRQGSLGHRRRRRRACSLRQLQRRSEGRAGKHYAVLSSTKLPLSRTNVRFLSCGGL